MNNWLSVSVWTEELRGRKRRICLPVSVWTEELRRRKRRICLSVLRKMDSYEGSPLSWSETSINIKLWREDYLDAARSIFTGMSVVGEVCCLFFCSLLPPVPLQSSLLSVCTPQSLGTMEGSGCAMINVLHGLKLSSELPSLGLLAAGEGSRLWGISASVGFVKGLLNVFGRTLVEQTVVQAEALMRQAPRSGLDFVLMSGTDNVFVPSVPLHLFGTTMPFRECQSRGLYTFSIPIRVRDPVTRQVIPGVLERLSQLGIMFSDGKGGAIMFREKPTHEQTMVDLDRYGADSVLVNAFVFALGREAAILMRDLYGRALPSSGKPIYCTKDFDWSGHVLTPIALAHAGQRMPQDREVFPSTADWDLVLDCAAQFYSRFGPICILNAGEDALWFDAGLTSDLVSLSKLALLETHHAHGPLCDVYDLPHHTPASSSLMVRSSICKTAIVSLGRGCVVSDCIFLEGARVTLPDNTILISCVIGGQWPAAGSESGALCYNLRPDVVAEPSLRLQEGMAYFAFAEFNGAWRRGSFPISANPKNGNLLNAPMEGVGKSFRELQRERCVSLSLTVSK